MTTAKLDPIYGIHADALNVQHRRMDILAANLANSDTPGYKARDIDFAKVLKATQAGTGPMTSLTSTNPLHLSGSASSNGHAPELQYREAMQPSIDGNTVDTQIEQSAFADASLHYRASLSFADGRLKSLLTAITGS